MTTYEERGDATLERIAKGENYVGKDKIRRFVDHTLTRLAERGGLYPDRTINRMLREAGERYYKDWYLGNLNPLAAFDPSRIYSGGSDRGTITEKQSEYRDNYRRAKTYIGKKYAEVVDLIVLQEQDFVSVGKQVSGRANPDVCRAIAMERLTAGLFLLAKHYGLIR